jgi:Gas vesicle synthesis protein GvpL/GvpF
MKFASDAMENDEPAIYLFCFARSDAVREVRGPAADGHISPSILRHSADLCAVVGEVRREEFCGPEAELHLQQLSWVAPRAVRHEAVIEEVMAHSPVLPARFGTLFSSAKALAEFVDRHRETITRFLERAADHEEWSVKGWFDRKQAQPTLMSANLTARQEQLSQLPPGTRHFAEQRLRRDLDRALSAWLDETCNKIVTDLTGYTSDFLECTVTPGTYSESGIAEVLNWAFLLPKSAIVPFQEYVERANLNHRAQGLLLELSGPWPPFRFVPALSATGAP